MVIVATLYSSIEMKRIDTWYSGLIDSDIKAQQDPSAARALGNRFGLYLYKEIAETDVDRMRVIVADLDETAAEFHPVVEDVKRESPSLALPIETATAEFDQAVSASRPVRAATLIQDNDAAMKLIRESADPDMAKARQSFVGLAEELRKKEKDNEWYL